MKYILTPIGSHGDLHPFVALGKSLRRRGHEVVLLAAGMYKEMIGRAALPFVDMGGTDEVEQMLENPDLWHPTRGPKKLFSLWSTEEVLRAGYDAIAEQYRPGETVVVAPGQAFAARVAQEKLGVPLATIFLSPSIIRSVAAPPKLPGMWMPAWLPHFARRFLFGLADRLIVDRLVCPGLDAFRAKLGLPPVRRPVLVWMNSPDCIIGLVPEWFAPRPPDWPPQLHLTGFPLYDGRDEEVVPPEVEDFLHAGPPPVVFTPGSANTQAHRFFAAAAEACLLGGRRGAFLTMYPKQLPDGLPDGVRHFRYVPLSKLLPQCAAIVHHGGIGTTSQGLAAGIPQLIMPIGYDQMDNAHRLERLGVAASLPVNKFTPGRVRDRLAALLTPTVQARCREVAAGMREDRGLEKAVDILERFGEESRRSGTPRAADPLAPTG